MKIHATLTIAACVSTLLSACDSGSSTNNANISTQQPGYIAGLISSRTLASLPATTNNYLVNPDFTTAFPPDWNISGEQPGWQACTSSNALSRVSANDSPQRRGTGFYAQLGRAQCLQQGITIAVGDELTFSCDISPFGTSTWNGLGMSFYDSNWNFISEPDAVSPVADGSTQNLAVTGKAPSGSAFVGVWYYTDTGAAMDNCVLSPANTHPRGQPDRNNFKETYVAFQEDTNANVPALTAGAAPLEPLFLIDGAEAEVVTLYDAFITHDGTDLIVRVSRGNWDAIGETLYSDSYPVNGFLWEDSSFEIYLNPGLEDTQGYDNNDLVRIYGIPTKDQTPIAPVVVHGVNSQAAVADNAVCSETQRGTETYTTCELRFSLAEMGMDIETNNEIGVDIHYNFDEDGGPRDAKYSACSGDTLNAWEDMSKVTCSVLLRPND